MDVVNYTRYFWAIVTYFRSPNPYYFTGNIVNERPEFTTDIHQAFGFSSKEDAEFGRLMLSLDAKDYKVEDHQVG